MVMKKKIVIQITLVCVLLTSGIAFANDKRKRGPARLPKETLVLKLPNNRSAWKELSRSVTEKEGLVEYIPSDQNATNWSELVYIQYFHKTSLKQKASNSIEDALELCRETTLASHPEAKVTWNSIEKNKSDAIYEWTLHEPLQNIAQECEVARVFLTEIGLCRIGFTRKNQVMTSEERARCIKLLKESVSLVGIEEAKRIPDGLSILKWAKEPIDLGEAFRRWRVRDSHISEDGIYTMQLERTLTPTFSFSTKHALNVLMKGGVSDPHSLDSLVEAQKENLWESLEYRTLKKTENEIIYSFESLVDTMGNPDMADHLSGVMRCFIENEVYVFASYHQFSHRKFKPEEIQAWKEKLEAIKLSN
jgi:hypothetical protein